MNYTKRGPLLKIEEIQIGDRVYHETDLGRTGIVTKKCNKFFALDGSGCRYNPTHWTKFFRTSTLKSNQRKSTSNSNQRKSTPKPKQGKSTSNSKQSKPTPKPKQINSTSPSNQSKLTAQWSSPTTAENSATYKQTVAPPPEYTPPAKEHEGYWFENYHPRDFISEKKWADKQKFLDLVRSVEESFHVSFIPPAKACYRGLAMSRLEPDTEVGNCEYRDRFEGKPIVWPSGYAVHYIGKHNIMPTERFFRYICQKWECLRNFSY